MSGRPRNLTTQQRFEEKYVVSPNSCWEWSASVNKRAGYGQFRLGSRMVYAHRVSWELHRGPVADGLYVLHRCDNRRCVNPGHLFLGTNDDNMADMVAKGRQARGQRHGSAKLTPDQVAEIRSLAGTMLHREIAALFGISKQQVGHILRGEQW